MRFFRVSVAAVAVAAAPPTFADLAPADIWTDWQAYSNALGLEITGKGARDGDNLVVEDIVISASFAEDAAEITVNLGTVRFEQAGEDVAIVMPPEITSESRVSAVQGVTDVTKSTIGHSGLDIIASGSPEDLKYALRADTVTAESALSVAANGNDLAQQTTVLTLRELAGETNVTLADARDINTSFSATSGEYEVTYNDLQSGEAADLKGRAETLTASGQNRFPLLISPDFDLSALLAAGLDVVGELEMGANTLEVSTSGASPVDALISSDGATVDYKLAETGLSYDVAQEGVETQVAAQGFPVPLAFAIEKAAFSIGMPVTSSDEAGDFGLGVNLDGFTMSEAVWALFDPQGGLPRDPARIALDLSGQARLLIDLLNPLPESAASEPDFTPVDLETLDLNTLEVSALGTTLTGNGAFTFADPLEGTNLPRPNGTVDLKLVGANALLDNLVSLGMLPEDQAMGARLMMGLFGVPSDAPDTLTSKIEVNEDFQVFANGQRIQ